MLVYGVFNAPLMFLAVLRRIDCHIGNVFSDVGVQLVCHVVDEEGVVDIDC